MLRSGMQVPLRLSFHNLRIQTAIVEKLPGQLEADSFLLSN